MPWRRQPRGTVCPLFSPRRASCHSCWAVLYVGNKGFSVESGGLIFTPTLICFRNPRRSYILVSAVDSPEITDVPHCHQVVRPFLLFETCWPCFVGAGTHTSARLPGPTAATFLGRAHTKETGNRDFRELLSARVEHVTKWSSVNWGNSNATRGKTEKLIFQAT
jgi:hypothetical protein